MVSVVAIVLLEGSLLHQNHFRHLTLKSDPIKLSTLPLFSSGEADNSYLADTIVHVVICVVMSVNWL